MFKNWNFALGGFAFAFSALFVIYNLTRKQHSAGKDNDDDDTDDDQNGKFQAFPHSKYPETENLISLLCAVAEDQATKEGFVHRGITCNNCGSGPLRGIRYKCANCIDFDICEQCEAEDTHLKTHVFLKIRIPIPPLANPRSVLLNVFYPGNPLHVSELSWEKLKELQKITHFDQIELHALHEQFKSLSTVETGDGGIDKATFEQSLGPLGIERNLVTDRIFAFFDQDNDGIINFSELVCGLSILCKGTLDEKILYAFKGYDLDNDGYISKDELRKMFKAYFYLSMELVRDVVRALEEDILDNFDDEAQKPISSVFTAPIPPSSLPPTSTESNNDTSSVLNNDGSILYDESNGNNYGAMETISQDAIDEMVEKTFLAFDKGDEGKISFEEFKEFIENDGTMIAWFDSLGTVF